MRSGGENLCRVIRREKWPGCAKSLSRTVQFYDVKNLLKPTALSEGGRRLYSEGDIRTLKLICLLRDLGLALDSIKGILHSENQTKVLLLLLDVQEKQLLAEVGEKQKQIQAIRVIRDNLLTMNSVSVNSMSDIEKTMNGKRKLKRIYRIMLIGGIMMDAVQSARCFMRSSGACGGLLSPVCR